LGYGKRILNFARDIGKIAGENVLKGIKRFTDKFVNNEAFNKIDKIVGVGERVLNGVEQSKESGLFNKVGKDINKVGENYAYERRQSILNPRYKRGPLDERMKAEKIVSNIK